MGEEVQVVTWGVNMAKDWQQEMKNIKWVKNNFILFYKFVFLLRVMNNRTYIQNNNTHIRVWGWVTYIHILYIKNHE